MALAGFIYPCCCANLEDKQNDLPPYILESESVGVVKASPCISFPDSPLAPCDPCEDGAPSKALVTPAWPLKSKANVRFAPNGWEPKLPLPSAAGDSRSDNGDEVEAVSGRAVGNEDSRVFGPQDAEGTLRMHKELLMEMGSKETTEGDWYRAAATYSAVLCLDQKDANAWAGRGNARLQRGDAAQALEDFEEALRLSANSSHKVPAFLGRADAKLTTGDLDGAIEDYVAFLHVAKESGAMPEKPSPPAEECTTEECPVQCHFAARGTFRELEDCQGVRGLQYTQHAGS